MMGRCDVKNERNTAAHAGKGTSKSDAPSGGVVGDLQVAEGHVADLLVAEGHVAEGQGAEGQVADGPSARDQPAGEAGADGQGGDDTVTSVKMKIKGRHNGCAQCGSTTTRNACGLQVHLHPTW